MSWDEESSSTYQGVNMSMLCDFLSYYILSRKSTTPWYIFSACTVDLSIELVADEPYGLIQIFFNSRQVRTVRGSGEQTGRRRAVEGWPREPHGAWHHLLDAADGAANLPAHQLAVPAVFP
jgi:hypothetical protein